MVRDINRQVSDQVKKEIDVILHKTHFKHSKIAEILGIEQTTYKTNRSKGLLTKAHLNIVSNYFYAYDEVMKLMP